MSQEPLAIVILAAGLGKRMKSDLPKVLIPTREKPLLFHVLESAATLAPEKLIVVTGHRKELVEETVKKNGAGHAFDPSKVTFAAQEKQLGTGDAAKSAMASLKGFVGTVIILYGDVPLIRPETLRSLLETHRTENNTLTLISFLVPPPSPYGRVVRDAKKHVERIVEAKDCSPDQTAINECNAGIYAVDSVFLEPALKELTNDNAQKEYYLTDIVGRAAKEGQRIGTVVAPDRCEMEGVNSPAELAAINAALLHRRRTALMESGVFLEDPATVYVDASVEVAPGARIGPNTHLLGSTKIAEGVVIEGNAYLVNTSVGARTRIKFGVRSEDAQVGVEAQIGPFANLRPGAVLEDESHMGNFVEMKKARLGKGAKANHLTYLGDCTIGPKANIGAGTITCNYDGYKKSETIIGAGAFIGSNASLVAPIKIGDGAVIGAGSVITKDVEPDALALTRAPQVTKPGWSTRKRGK